MNVDANAIIAKLGDQIKQLVISNAVKDVQIENLQSELSELKLTENTTCTGNNERGKKEGRMDGSGHSSGSIS